MNPAVLASFTDAPCPHVHGDVPDLSRAHALRLLLAAHDADVVARHAAAQRKAHRVAVLASWWQTACAVVKRDA